jgi:hypothetical protein
MPQMAPSLADRRAVLGHLRIAPLLGVRIPFFFRLRTEYLVYEWTGEDSKNNVKSLVSIRSADLSR